MVRRLIQEAAVREAYERTPVVMMQVSVASATLQEKLRAQGLRLRCKSGEQELMITEITKAVPAEEGQAALFDFNTTASCALRGDEPLCFEVVKSNMVMPNRVVGRSFVSLSELREAFGGMALTCAQGAVVRELIVYDVPSYLYGGDADEVIGTLLVQVSFGQTTLGSLARRLGDGDHENAYGASRPRDGGRRPPPARSEQAFALRQARAYAEAQRPRAYAEAQRPRTTLVGRVPPSGQAADVAPQPDGTVIIRGQPLEHESSAPAGDPATQQGEVIAPAQAFRTADGGQVCFQSWTDSETGEQRHAAVQTAQDGTVVQRIEWTGSD